MKSKDYSGDILLEKNYLKEKAESYGIDTLTNKEILLLLSSKKNKEVINELIEKEIDIIEYFFNNDISYLKNTFGQNAIIIKSILELNIRRHKKEQVKCSSPESVANYMMEKLRYLKHEEFHAIYVNSQNKVICSEKIFVGSADMCIFHPREVFKGAIKYSAVGLIVVHNHPSGDTMPSREDIQITTRLCECGRIIGINFLDHIIISDGKFTSLRNKGYM